MSPRLALGGHVVGGRPPVPHRVSSPLFRRLVLRRLQPSVRDRGPRTRTTTSRTPHQCGRVHEHRSPCAHWSSYVTVSYSAVHHHCSSFPARHSSDGPLCVIFSTVRACAVGLICRTGRAAVQMSPRVVHREQGPTGRYIRAGEQSFRTGDNAIVAGQRSHPVVYVGPARPRVLHPALPIARAVDRIRTVENRGPRRHVPCGWPALHVQGSIVGVEAGVVEEHGVRQETTLDEWHWFGLEPSEPTHGRRASRTHPPPIHRSNIACPRAAFKIVADCWTATMSLPAPHGAPSTPHGAWLVPAWSQWLRSDG